MTSPSTVAVLDQDQLGHGDRDVGSTTRGTFLRKCVVLHGLETIALENGGVRLVAADSPGLAELSCDEDDGAGVLPCGTCVEALGIDVAIGRVSDADEVFAKAENVGTL